MEHSTKDRQQVLTDAVGHLRLALQLLDDAGAPAQIGAHVDLALHQLEDELMQNAGDELSPAQCRAARN